MGNYLAFASWQIFPSQRKMRVESEHPYLSTGNRVQAYGGFRVWGLGFGVKGLASLGFGFPKTIAVGVGFSFG